MTDHAAKFTTITGIDWRAALIAARARRAKAHERSLKKVIKHELVLATNQGEVRV
jgi:hypothetical protein